MFSSAKPAFIAFAVLALVGFGYAQPAVDRPKNLDPPSKEEGGILTTLVSSYMAVRNAVKFTYDEIKYFERMYDTYESMGLWFERNKRRVDDIFDATTQLVTDPEDVFTTLRRMEGIFDRVDYLVLYETHKFDAILAGGENLWDAATARNNAYTGLIVPNTEGVLSYIEALFTGNPAPTQDEYDRMTPEDWDAWNQNHIAQERINSLNKDAWPEEKARRASVLIASSAMAKSAAFSKWSLRANQNIAELDGKLAGVKGVNQQSLAAAWYALENANANNKRIQHSAEELKALLGILGADLYFSARARTPELHQSSLVGQMRFPH